MKRIIFPTLLFFSIAIYAQESRQTQIAAAVLAAPENTRDGAKVYGYIDGKWAVLREGTNKMVCIADNPGKEGFSVACYHADLDPFMERGRQLKAAGKERQEIFDIREEEVKDKKLHMPERTTLHILSGKDAYYDAESGKVEKGNFRWVIYIPYSTAESTGLPLAPPSQGAPWLMDPGTHRAHIMITPPKN